MTMTTIPTYQLRRATEADNAQNEAADWRRRCMAEDVVQLQLLKQHHYHPYNETSQGRVPLAGCQKSDRPGLCKSDFPRTQWLCAQPIMPLQVENVRDAKRWTKKSLRSFAWTL